jgi:Protein of unknown function (DUF1566)/PEGA domain
MQRRTGISTRTPVTIAIVLFVTFLIGVAAAAAGTLKVTSFPSGAQVIVDGVNTGKLTPMNISLADGDHIVTVQIPGSGWNADTRTVTIGPGNNDLSVTLLPMTTAGPAGPKGDKGDTGDTGASGTNGTSVTFVNYFSGNQNGCPNGGAIYATGNPPVNTYVCNGFAARADGPCFDNVNRYVDCGNGTATDTVTGLIWLKRSNCLPADDWAAANQAAASLQDGDCGLTDGSSAGDWRLPTKAEWTAMVARAIALSCGFGPTPIGFAPEIVLLNVAGTGCYFDGSPRVFPSVSAGHYWSSTSHDTSPTFAEMQSLIRSVQVFFRAKNLTGEIWPVRGGPR